MYLLIYKWTIRQRFRPRVLSAPWGRFVRFVQFVLNDCGLINSLDQEGSNPNGGVESFDNIYLAALQVLVVTSANTVCVFFVQLDVALIPFQWSPVMYSIIDAEYFVSCFFFIVCILVLNIWLINLFVAVITNTFSAIRSDTHKSAFGAAPCVSDFAHMGKANVIPMFPDWDLSSKGTKRVG